MCTRILKEHHEHTHTLPELACLSEDSYVLRVPRVCMFAACVMQTMVLIMWHLSCLHFESRGDQPEVDRVGALGCTFRVGFASLVYESLLPVCLRVCMFCMHACMYVFMYIIDVNACMHVCECSSAFVYSHVAIMPAFSHMKQ
jgi:hypothetical protein